MIFWIFRTVPCHAFCMWHWPMGKDLDLSFIWGHHHLHLVGLWISVDQLITSQLATPCWRDPTRSKQLSTVAILGFQFGLYHVVAPLSFLRSISLASLFANLTKMKDLYSVKSQLKQMVSPFTSIKPMESEALNTRSAVHDSVSCDDVKTTVSERKNEPIPMLHSFKGS